MLLKPCNHLTHHTEFCKIDRKTHVPESLLLKLQDEAWTPPVAAWDHMEAKQMICFINQLNSFYVLGTWIKLKLIFPGFYVNPLVSGVH